MSGIADYPFQDYRNHSVYFDNFNSWDEWHMIPTARPSIVTPAMVENTVDVPGMNGSLDLSEALTGYPLYENRSGSITFMFLNGFGNWVERKDSIMSKLHGKYMKLTLSDDPNYYYEGRITCGDWSTNKDMSSIDINYNVKPYAIHRFMDELDEIEIAAGATETVTFNMSETDVTIPVVACFKYTGGDLNNVLNLTFTNTELGYAVANVTIKRYEDAGLVSYEDVQFSNIIGTNQVAISITNSNAKTAKVKIGYYAKKL